MLTKMSSLTSAYPRIASSPFYTLLVTRIGRSICRGDTRSNGQIGSIRRGGTVTSITASPLHNSGTRWHLWNTWNPNMKTSHDRKCWDVYGETKGKWLGNPSCALFAIVSHRTSKNAWEKGLTSFSGNTLPNISNGWLSIPSRT